ncbi:MAG: DUF4157 domain-containing protein [Rhodospirillales bacterium]|nr:DUF4157 domain-containing protein [Rhodospirillales bacterium]
MSTDRRSIRGLAARCVALLLLAAAWQVAGRPLAGLEGAGEQAAAFAAETAAPLLARWLTASAEMAARAGVVPVPAEISEALDGFVEPAVLERVRYRIGVGNLASIATLALLHPHTRALAVDGVIVFRNQKNAAKPRYWVHEIVHLEQIRRWGVQRFAARYIRDPGAVEAEAWELTDRYVAWSLRRELNAAADVRSSRRDGS